MSITNVKNALISVHSKDNLIKLAEFLIGNDIKIYATGSTFKFLVDSGIDANNVKDITDFDNIIGGRVKTLHPKIFAGILRTDDQEDKKYIDECGIVEFDLVVINLYPFEKVYNDKNSKESDIIENIDIGGVSLIRAAAKNFNKVSVLTSPKDYDYFIDSFKCDGGISISKRKELARHAFERTYSYDMNISSFFNSNSSIQGDYRNLNKVNLRYGENPHQKATFYGDINNAIEKISGNRNLSYNNLLDIDVAVRILEDFAKKSFFNQSGDKCIFTIIKHLNPCGLAMDGSINKAFKKAMEVDTVSAFGGVFATNGKVDVEVARSIDKYFFEVLIAASFDKEALEILSKKKRRILIINKNIEYSDKEIRSLLNGVLEQEKDWFEYDVNNLEVVTDKKPTTSEKKDLIFAMKASKHMKSNSIAISKNLQIVASGKGQTSRIDSIKYAIEKAMEMSINLEGSVMASDAFFPFGDSVSYAAKYGIKSIIQPGGSIRDNESIDRSNENDISMIFTKIRHFKH